MHARKLQTKMECYTLYGTRDLKTRRNLRDLNSNGEKNLQRKTVKKRKLKGRRNGLDSSTWNGTFNDGG